MLSFPLRVSTVFFKIKTYLHADYMENAWRSMSARSSDLARIYYQAAFLRRSVR
jgi:hypothetical protein